MFWCRPTNSDWLAFQRAVQRVQIVVVVRSLVQELGAEDVDDAGQGGGIVYGLGRSRCLPGSSVGFLVFGGGGMSHVAHLSHLVVVMVDVAVVADVMDAAAMFIQVSCDFLRLWLWP